MPTAWRTLTEIAGAGARADRRTIGTVSTARGPARQSARGNRKTRAAAWNAVEVRD
jgi:hypothetical protein